MKIRTLFTRRTVLVVALGFVLLSGLGSNPAMAKWVWPWDWAKSHLHSMKKSIESSLQKNFLQMAANFLSKKGIDVTWGSEKVHFHSISLLRKEMTLDFTGLCIRERTQGAYDACFEHASISLQGGLIGFKPRVTVLGPVNLDNGSGVLNLKKMAQVEKRKKPGKPPGPFRIRSFLPASVRNAEIRPLKIDLRQLRVDGKSWKLRGNLLLAERSSPHEAKLVARTRGEVLVDQSGFHRGEHYRIHFGFVNSKGVWAWNSWKGDGKAYATLADGRTVNLTLGLEPRWMSPTGTGSAHKPDRIALNYQVSGNTMKSGGLIVAKAIGSYTSRHLTAHLSGSARNVVQKVKNLRLDSCDLELRKVSAQGESRYDMDCSIYGTVPAPPKKLAFLQIPTEEGVQIRADLTSTDFLPSKNSRVNGDVDLSLKPILTPLVHGRGEMHVRLDGVAGEFPRQGSAHSRVALELQVPDFHKLQQRLRGTGWGVPAPLTNLKGSVTLWARGSGNLKKGLFPVGLRTRLKSKSEDMNVDANGTLQLARLREGPSAELNFALILDDLKVVLPRLALEKPPRFIPDPRIHPFKPHHPKHKKKALLGYRIAIRTPPGKPVQVITNLAKAPVPVNLDVLVSNDAPPSGKIQVASFPVQFFRRKATVQHFDINLEPDIGDSEINGQIDTAMGDYKAHVHLIGSIDKPRMTLTSEPPVRQDQLLGALLFNRPPEELDAGESASVGSTQATLSQGALSLASIFLLASTPIQSLTYNPDTGQVTAQVRLGEGLALNVGSGANRAGTVGLRKRIGPNFFITTDLNNLVQDGNTVSAYLEWRRRY